jgi:hypothetical protein
MLTLFLHHTDSSLFLPGWRDFLKNNALNARHITGKRRRPKKKSTQPAARKEQSSSTSSKNPTPSCKNCLPAAPIQLSYSAKTRASSTQLLHLHRASLLNQPYLPEDLQLLSCKATSCTLSAPSSHGQNAWPRSCRPTSIPQQTNQPTPISDCRWRRYMLLTY